MGNLARFTVNATPSQPPGFDADPLDVLSLRLEAPSGVVRRWTVSVHDDVNADAPAASKDAPQLTLVGGTSGSRVDALSALSAILCEMPETTGHSWLFRSTVNGGLDSRGLANPDYVFERIVSIRTQGLRKVVTGESTQYAQSGVFDAVNDLIDAFTGSGFGDTNGLIVNAAGSFLLNASGAQLIDNHVQMVNATGAFLVNASGALLHVG